MLKRELLATAKIPGSSGSLQLIRRGEEFLIEIEGVGGLMGNVATRSEEELATLTAERLGTRSKARVLIGGLGMGFTLAAALKRFPKDASLVVAELVPELVEWNRGPMGASAGHPLKDPRTEVYMGDVADLLRKGKGAYDAVLLDVDNGPEGLTLRSNDWLYLAPGLRAAHRALRPQGVLAVWSAGPDKHFKDRLVKAGFQVEERQVRAQGMKGRRHVVWVAQRG
ncbi:MAG: hypothetical protein JNM31_10760 [Flavobacteriales bacterium]|nr:hypothetical protein [Flavobacteriales bacterium]